MIRPLLCVAALALAVSSVTQVIAASPRYAITQLRPVAIAAGTYSNVYDINDNGLAVGNETRLNPANPLLSATRGLTWTTGVDAATVLATPTGGIGTTAYGVNNAGQIVGKAYLSSGGVATAMLGSSSSTLLTQSGTLSVNGINISGDVIGQNSAGAFVIRNGVVTQLNAGNYASSGVFASGINDAGTIVGGPLSSSAGPRALRLSTTAEPVEIVSVSASVNAINDAGVSAGYVQINSSGLITGTAAIFAGGGNTQLGNIPRAGDTRPLGGIAYDLNERGDVIGVSGPATGSQLEQAPFLYRDGQLLNIVSLIEGTLPPGFRPRAINNRGQIVGEVYVDHDSNSATPRIAQSYRLDPIRVAGDANVDGIADFADLQILAAAYGGTSAAYYETGDFNYDWRVDLDDLKILAAAYATPATLAADLAGLGLPIVPEPTTLATLSLAGLLTRRCRRIG